MFILFSANAFNLDRSKILPFGKNLNTAVTKCNALTETGMLYTDGHMEGHTDGQTNRLISVYLHSFCRGITLSQTTNFRPFQIERVCR